jgi:ABC-type polysaccharide/polyol phosphate transport system ATPase subunit
MAAITFKVETPKNLDSIFSLECFKYNEMKGVFKNIYEYLTMFGLKIDEMDSKFAGIPDFSKVMSTLDDI